MPLELFLRRILILFLCAFHLQVFSKEMYRYAQSIRSLGMGGAYLGIVKDADVIFYNPASLRRVEGLNLEILNLGAGVNGLQIYNDIQNLGQVNGLSSLTPFYGKNIWLGLDGKIALAVPYFGFGVYDTGFLSMRLQNPAFPTLDMSLINDTGYVLGTAIPVGPGAALGLSVKRITRLGGTTQIGPGPLINASNSSLQNQFQNQGLAYGLDTGFVLTAPLPFSPTVSIAWKDVGSTAFSKTAGTDAPERIKDNLAIGFGVQGSVPLLGFAAGFDYDHITDADEQIGKKLHMGAEVSIAMFDLRAGFYQGYTTYGLGMDLWLLKFDIASYSEELGVYPGQTPDARIRAAITLQINFDPSFNFSGFTNRGSGRHLKQRR